VSAGDAVYTNVNWISEILKEQAQSAFHEGVPKRQASRAYNLILSRQIKFSA